MHKASDIKALLRKGACADFFPSETTLLKCVMTPAESIKQHYYGSIIFSL